MLRPFFESLLQRLHSWVDGPRFRSFVGLGHVFRGVFLVEFLRRPLRYCIGRSASVQMIVGAPRQEANGSDDSNPGFCRKRSQSLASPSAFHVRLAQGYSSIGRRRGKMCS